MLHQSPAFAEYAKQTFGVTIQEPVKSDRIVIAELKNGDAGTGAIGGDVAHWWVVDDLGTRLVHWPKLPRDQDSPDNRRGQVYLIPLIKFLRQGELIAIGEAFGPELICRKVGNIAIQNGIASLHNMRVLWNIQSIGPPVMRWNDLS